MQKYLNKYFAIILLLCAFSGLFAGEYAGDFLSIGAGVQATAMGGAFIAVADDGSALYWNTAGLGQIKKAEVSMTRSFLYDGLAVYDYLSYTQPLPNRVSLGVSWTRLSIESVPVFLEKYLIGSTVDQRVLYPELHLPGVPDDEFTSSDDVFQFGFSKNLSSHANLGWLFFSIPFDLYFGGSVKYIKRKIHTKLGNGTGFDFGWLFKLPTSVIFDQAWMGKAGFGLTMQNIGGSTIIWDTDSNHEDVIPFSIRTGFSYEQKIPRYKSSITLAYDHENEYAGAHHYGIRMDYDERANLLLGLSENRWSAGVAVKIYNFYLDYAFYNTKTIKRNTNQVGIRLIF